MKALILKTLCGLGWFFVVAAPLAVDADVGRLFFTPSERAAFEAARRAGQTETEVVEVEPEQVVEIIETAPPPAQPIITVDGYVRRTDGHATLWVNGQNSYDGDLSTSGVEPRGASVSGNRVSVTPRDAAEAVKLRPGQSYDPNTAITTDAYDTPAFADEFAEQ